MKKNWLQRGLIAAAIIVAATAGYAKYHPLVFQHAVAATAPDSTVTESRQSVSAGTLPDFTAIVEQNGPAVVNISVTNKAEKSADVPGIPKLDPDDPFYEFYRRFRGPMPQGEMPLHGVGSGFIISADGTILTNAHVVEGASNVTVKLTDKREFKAKVVGVDKPSDVAVLKIDASNLPIVKLDPVDDVKVGEWVLAIGSPFGFENSATSGIVSAKSRTLPSEAYVPFIQTDVAVNPGNSGGPLFNLKGEVIGINSQIYSRTGGYQGLSFAIPINVALHVKEQLLAHGSVTRGRLGLMIQDVDQALADSFGLKKPAGALVSQVEKDSPAAKAGLMAGDVILRYDGKEIVNSVELPVFVVNAAPGSIAHLDVLRKGETRHIDVTVGTLQAAKVAVKDLAGEKHDRLGVVVRPLSRDEQQEIEVDGGVVVEDSAGPAAEAGIQPGDVILSLNGMQVKSPAHLKQLLTKAGKHVALLVQREEAKIFVSVDLG